MDFSDTQNFQYAAQANCEHETTEAFLEERFLNVGGSLFPALAQEGDLFRFRGVYETGGLGHWVNGRIDVRTDLSSESRWISFDPSPVTEALGRGTDVDGDGLSDGGGGARFDTDRWEVCVEA